MRLYLPLLLSLVFTTQAMADPGQAEPPKKLTEPGFEPAPGFEQDVKKATPKKAVKRATPRPVSATLTAMVDAKAQILDLSQDASRAHVRGVSRVRIEDENAPLCAAIRADFMPTGVEGSRQLLVLDPKNGAQLYEGTTRMARDKTLKLMTPSERKALGIEFQALPVSLVGDKRAEVLVWRKVKKGKRVIFMATVLRVFGNYIGRTFDREIGYKDLKTGKIARTATVDVLRAEPHHKLRYTPINAAGELDRERASVLEWNHWEGAYRTPRSAPTAPRRKRPRASR